MGTVSYRAMEEYRQYALDLGFLDIAVLPANIKLQEYESTYRQWIAQYKHAGMSYLERNMEVRFNPNKLFPSAQSIVLFIHSYFPEHDMPFVSFKIARYAWGKDYHRVLKKKMKKWCDYVAEKEGNFQYRLFTDSAPVLERQLAEKAGLGWRGKNSLLINKKFGSYFFISEIFTDLAFERYSEVKNIYNHCGTCTRCIDHCPTQALEGNGLLDASKCISYLTIENKEDTIEPVQGKRFQGWIFGCDICQEVCPWNKFSFSHQETAFLPQNTEIFTMTKEEWIALTEDRYNRLFAGTPVKRAGYKGLHRNITAVAGNK